MSPTSLPAGGPSTTVRPKVTDFAREPVSLETDTENSQVQQEALLRAWVELYPHSVEAALANQSDMLEFGNNHCLFFAAVLWNHIAPVRLRPSPTVWPLLNGEPLQSLAPSVTFADDGAVNSTAQTAAENEAGSVVETMRVWDTVGVVYIASSPLPSQVHIGVGILPAFRRNGLGRRACEIALGWAVDTLQMHRVQARILPSPHQHRSRSLFAALGLVHEGVHRRAVLSPSGEWADVAHMGLLDTDWHIRSRLVAQPTSLWDELLGRHQREVEDMLRFEERQRSVRRTSSMETIRVALDPDPVPEWQQRGRPVCTPSGPSLASTSPSSSRASSEAPDTSSEDTDADMPYRSDPPLDDPRWGRFFEDLRARDVSGQSPPDSPVPRPPSTASNSSYASVGSAASLLGRRNSIPTDSEDEEWVSLEPYQ
ncbi:hypothetical protein VTO73DRAFT_11568 [Trametes versicolor]